MRFRRDQIIWGLSRASRMSPAELLWRLWEQGKRAIDRGRTFGWEAFETDLDDFSPPKVVQAQSQWPSPDRAGLASLAQAVRQGRLSALSPALPDLEPGFWRDPGVWRRDPETGSSWPEPDRFALDMAYRRAQGWDVRRAWELSRLTWLQALAMHSKIEAATAAEDVWDGLAAWMEQNPPFRGLAWTTGIEAASRVVSILVVMANVDLAASRSRATVFTFLGAHRWWIARYPSLFSSANNHRIAELSALCLCALTIRAWRGDYARRRAELERQVLRSFHNDGVGCEQSPAYAAYTLEWLALVDEVARSVGQPLSAPVEARLAVARDHLAWMRDAGGRTPSIGDDDQSRVVAAPAQITPDDAPEGVRTFAEGGLTVWRSRLDGRPVLLVFDHGPLGHLSIAAHGHADALSLWLHWGDETVFADAGTGTYHGLPTCRDALRGTAAHNTLCLDGENQSRIVGPFAWARHARTRVIDGGDGWIEAEHDGYRRRFGVLHRRRVSFRGNEIAVEDRLIGRPKNPGASYSLGFLLGLGVNARVDCEKASATTAAGRRLELEVEAGGAGWKLEAADISTAYGRSERTTRLTLDGVIGDADLNGALARIRIRLL